MFRKGEILEYIHSIFLKGWKKMYWFSVFFNGENATEIQGNRHTSVDVERIKLIS